MASTAAKIGAAAIAIAILLVTWRVVGAGPVGPLPEVRSPTPTVVDAKAPDASPGPAEPRIDGPAAEAREPAATSRLPSTQPAANEPVLSTFSFLGRFVQPDEREIQVRSAWVVLTGSHGLIREATVADAKTVLVRDLVPDVYVARVSGPDFDHREQVLDLTRPEHASEARSKETEAAFEERLILWPESWIAVVVLTPGGRSFEELADELGIECKRLFVDAFDVLTRSDPPGADAWVPSADPQPATWRAPSVYQSWSLTGACVGSLQVLEPPPFWVGLTVHGAPLGWEIVHPGDRQVVFRLDARALEERLAAVRMRVLEAPGGAAKGEARVTLKADTSAHRREDQANVQPDAGGRVAFVRIVPGRYELSIEGGGALHQELLELLPGEQRDLGDIVLRDGVAVPIHAVDEQGKPAVGWVEIAPYRRGERVRNLYPPNLHRSLDRNGEFQLPMPSELSIVRVTLADPATGRQTNRLSQNVLLDPDRPPTGRLELAVREPVRVGFDIARGAGVRIIEVLDELGLVVEVLACQDGGILRTDLAPGRYSARRVEDSGRGLPATTFVVADQPFDMQLP